MDRSWIDSNDRFSSDYSEGSDSFIEFALSNQCDRVKINCPRVRCQNWYLYTPTETKQHCLMWGFMKWYKFWSVHGETTVSLHGESSRQDFPKHNYEGDDMIRMIHDAVGINDIDDVARESEDFDKVLKLLEEANVPFSDGCNKLTSLSFITRLLQLKVLNEWSNKSVDMLLELFKEAFSEMKAKISKNFYEASKITKVLGLQCNVWAVVYILRQL